MSSINTVVNGFGGVTTRTTERVVKMKTFKVAEIISDHAMAMVDPLVIEAKLRGNLIDHMKQEGGETCANCERMTVKLTIQKDVVTMNTTIQAMAHCEAGGHCVQLSAVADADDFALSPSIDPNPLIDNYFYESEKPIKPVSKDSPRTMSADIW